MASNKSFGVVFLDRNRVSLFAAGMPSVASWEVPQTLVQDLDVLNSHEFESQLQAFMLQQKFDVGQVVVVLAEAVYFTKTLTGKTTQEQEKEVETFMGSVPCETLLSKTYRVENQRIIVAACGELVDVLTEAMTRAGSTVAAVVPQLLLGAHATKRWMDNEMATWILSHVASLLPWSMTVAQSPTYQEPQSKPATANLRLPQLLAIIGVLLVILLVVLMRQF